VTLDGVFQALRDRDAALVVCDGSLRYLGPTTLAADDPLQAGIAEHRALLIELFTYAPGGRCVADECYRLKLDGADRCPEHRRQLDTLPANVGAAGGRAVAGGAE
jgi:hypothetical protein